MKRYLIVGGVLLAVNARFLTLAEPPPLGPVLIPAQPVADLQAVDPVLLDEQNQPAPRDLLTNIVLKLLPDEYVDDDDWGKTSERWDGLKVHLDGLRIKTKRRKKEVNHGDWQRYTIRLVDAEERFRVEATNMRQAEDGRLAMDIAINAPLSLHARHARWVKGVQLYSVEAAADADVQLEVTAHVGMRVAGTRFTPEVAVLPEITDSRVERTHFELHRVSDLRGDVAEELGRQLRDVLDDQLVKKREKLTEKINRQVQKNQHHLRFSVPELLDSQFSELLEQAK